jgi:TatA/E family protein of Tat protein translocase
LEEIMGALSPWHLVLVLAVALLVLGPGKLPETGAAIGKAIRSFREAVDGQDEGRSQAATTALPAPTGAPLPAAPAAAPAPAAEAPAAAAPAPGQRAD